MPKLAYSLTFPDLYTRAGLERVDAAFLEFLGERNGALAERLRAARHAPAQLSRADESALLLALAPELDAYIGVLFDIERELGALTGRHLELRPLYEVKRQFVQRKANAAHKPAAAAAFDGAALERRLVESIGASGCPDGRLTELAFARAVQDWQRDEAAHAERIDCALRYAAWALHTDAGRARHRDGLLFQQPAKLDPMALVPVVAEAHAGATVWRLPAEHLRRRTGFALTDSGTDLAGALDEANYCIWCHHQAKDSCSRGLLEKAKGTPEEQAARPAAERYKKSPFGVTLAGCPLEERISEFHEAKVAGHAVGALAIIVVDNPMLAATGHRICNDCMKSCIYQKQQPVDIPQAETRTLKDVLALPWGFEIYSLLTRWNPLDLRRPLPRPPSGRRVLVVGLGPAGFTLAHHLLNDGHTVVGIDGLKIEPLAPALGGVAADGSRVAFEPVRDVQALYEALDARVMAGFGGVAEYGITVRWDKNFLKLVRLLLERRAEFAMLGGVRFGGTLALDDAFGALGAGGFGFDHVALAAGAGRPTVLDLPNGLARGVRTASDFLMALQLTGAARTDSIANMQLRLPVVVIGGGLTAIDTATESLAYYPVQVEKFRARYEALAAESGEAAVRARFTAEEAAIADEFLTHARALAAERAQAAREGRAPRLLELLDAWGGVTIAYRRRLVDSPSYTLNHEEVEKALEEGIRFAEGLTPTRIDVDADGHCASISFERQQYTGGQWQSAGSVTLPARAILIAAGTHPNTVLAREDAAHFRLDGRYFEACDDEGRPVRPEPSISKPGAAQVFLSRQPDGRMVSFFGDLHPSYSGNVVKAMGSAKQGYPAVSAALARLASPAQQADGLAAPAFLERINARLRARVHAVNRLTPTIVEVIVHAPAAAQRFQPGQFYRLQNFETHAPRAAPAGLATTLAMEGLALTGAWVDTERGLVSTIVLEMGGSSDLCRRLAPGEPVILMGPTGAPTETPAGETVLLAGGGLGNAVLFSIGAALRAAGSRVLYFAGYKRAIDRYKVAEIEAAADAIVWCCDEQPGFVPNPQRPQDRALCANIVEAMLAYARGELGPAPIALADVDRVIAIGSDRMMAAVAAARHGALAPYLRPSHHAIGSINSPMQCMMKEICAQCLQPHVGADGRRRYVFSCFNQDQPLDRVDFPALGERLKQNAVQEKLTALWIARCARELTAPAV